MVNNSSIIDNIISKHRNKNNINTHAKSNRDKKKFVSTKYGNFLNNTVQDDLDKNNITVTLRTHNKLQAKLKQTTNKYNNKYFREEMVVYKLMCDDCSKYYIRQKRNSFSRRFKEKLPKSNIRSVKSNYADILIDFYRKYTDLQTNMKILQFYDKSNYMKVSGEIEIYRVIKLNPDNV